MKIAPIHNYTKHAETSNANPGFKKSINNSQPLLNQNFNPHLMLLDMTYGSLLAKKTSAVSFKGAEKIPKILPEALEKIPFEERLASLVEILDKDAVILISESKKTLNKLLERTEGIFPDVIRRAFFLPEPAIKEGVGIMRTDLGPAVVNLGTKPITVSHPGKPVMILPQKGGYWALEGNKVGFDHFSFTIKEKPENNLSMLRHSFSEPFDRSEDVQKTINKLNRKTLTEFLAEKKKESLMTFDKIGGLNKQIEVMKRNFLYPIQYPFMYKNRNINHGAILYGPAGTGKSMLAKTVANEAGCYYSEVNAGRLSGGLVGETEKNWDNWIQDLVDNQPSIGLIDECSAVFKKRGGWDVHGDDAQEFILAKISDVEKGGHQVFFIGTTNRPESLDPAILRGGRFGLQIEVPNPDAKGLLEILNKKLADFSIEPKFNIEEYAKALHEKNLNGSDINQIMNDASDLAMERLGYFDKMGKGLIKESDQDFQIIAKDMYNALQQHVEQNLNASGKGKRNPVGFKPVSNSGNYSQNQMVAKKEGKTFG